MTSQLLGSRCCLAITRILQHRVQIPKIYRPRKASASKREMSLGTAIPKTSSLTPEFTQGRHNKKTVVPMETIRRAKII
ncbi:hypothetical protein Bca4012_037289 [Brassica carinata]